MSLLIGFYLFDPTGELPIVKISFDKSQKEPEQKEFHCKLTIGQSTSLPNDIVTSDK